MQFKKALPKVKLHKLSKVNKTKNVNRCVHCLELSTFRIITANGVNRLACIMCLNSTRYFKFKLINQHDIVFSGTMTLKHKIERTWLRLKTWVKGNHIYGPFGRRRKK